MRVEVLQQPLWMMFLRILRLPSGETKFPKQRGNTKAVTKGFSVNVRGARSSGPHGASGGACGPDHVFFSKLARILPVTRAPAGRGRACCPRNCHRFFGFWVSSLLDVWVTWPMKAAHPAAGQKHSQTRTQHNNPRIPALPIPELSCRPIRRGATPCFICLVQATTSSCRDQKGYA